ncbi:hypothetical protein AURANDRAFT_63009 [Aureococcus anophagefferens]|uniref:Uncharacterized protein n=1 Tax=Aureococcus anophagefferens TaxID=44056 RepID=F0Y531_AURAN|nr:hypothetical protein AURANDRAFT_63009 [Aureococcus anophagefferens]EGB09422.1 hypothetical protein AURANDRAFT_63009 [Aureococcus anophagefferens]|eukprot:XP_009035492.1 hypothetical protein AURANDRAFT_63009 [Aureococcus anophagefferens]
MYGDREDFDTPSMNFGLFMHKATCPGSGVLPAMTARHAVEYYDKLFKWWTRLRAVDVEAKLSELVAVANAYEMGPYFAESHYGEDHLVGNTYVVLAMICMAAGARVPPELAQAFAKAAENEARRVRAAGAPVDSIAVAYRRTFAAMVHDHDFSDSKTRMFIREAFGPRELNFYAHVEAGNIVIGDRRDYAKGDKISRSGMRMAWTPSKDQPVPRMGTQGLGRATLSPWVNTPTCHELAAQEPPVVAPFAPPDVDDNASPPTLEGVSVYQFKRAPPSIEELKREHAANAESYEPTEPLGPDGKSAQQIVDEKADDIRDFYEAAFADASSGGKKKTRRGGKKKKKKKQPEPAASEAAGRLDAASIGVVVAAAAKRIAVLHRAKGDHNFDDEDLVGRSYGEKLLPFITTLVDPAEPMPPQLMVLADLIEQGETDDVLTDLTFAERAPETPGSMEKVISVPAWSSDDEDTYEDTDEETVTEDEDTDEETVAEDDVVDPSLPPATEAALRSENARLRERLAAAEARAAAAEASLAANAAAPAAPVYNFL